MSDQQGEQSGRELGSLDAGSTAPTSPGATDDRAADSMLDPAMTGSGFIAPDHEAPKEDPPATAVSKAESPGSATPNTEPFRREFTPPGAAGADAPRRTGQLVVLSPGERTWHSGAAERRPSGRRRLAAMAAVAALALLGGSVGGVLATAGLTHDADRAAALSADSALRASVSRTDADIAALKAALARTKQLSLSRFNETKDRLDKIEKAETAPAAKLASLSAAVEKLRAQPATPARVAAVTAASDVTGSITTPQGAAALPKPAISPLAAKADIRRPPVVHDWVLRDVGHGGALIQGRRGFYEVHAGDPLPGLGRVAAIRRLDGRWAVVTAKGLIIAR